MSYNGEKTTQAPVIGLKKSLVRSAAMVTVGRRAGAGGSAECLRTLTTDFGPGAPVPKGTAFSPQTTAATRVPSAGE